MFVTSYVVAVTQSFQQPKFQFKEDYNVLPCYFLYNMGRRNELCLLGTSFKQYLNYSNVMTKQYLNYSNGIKILNM
jgi:hypothetical protein